MNVKMRLHRDRIPEVSAILFPLGRTVDWEMWAVNGVCEELTVSTDDMSLLTQLLKICEFTSKESRRRIFAEIARIEKVKRENGKRAALLAKIRARERFNLSR